MNNTLLQWLSFQIAFLGLFGKDTNNKVWLFRTSVGQWLKKKSIEQSAKTLEDLVVVGNKLSKIHHVVYVHNMFGPRKASNNNNSSYNKTTSSTSSSGGHTQSSKVTSSSSSSPDTSASVNLVAAPIGRVKQPCPHCKRRLTNN
ncbi:hypothetical protein BG015_011051 [Linnemannia schmuckeri]|uniref:Uncharacterized protein n=1 Tax=Linnemannia schmuckeri TaxID=64567 RepID=A0A9P5RVY2_9FUNG|nr:hypothetical protein BG015_011051 [Linnemannia schmuckeri]